MVPSTKFLSFQEVLKSTLQDKNSVIYRQYLIHKIREGWQDIAGKLAEHSSPGKIDKSRLIVTADSAPLANQLFMIKRELLKKVNQFLKSEYVFLDMSFVSGSVKKSGEAPPQEEEEEEIIYVNCPRCQTKIPSTQKLCFNCLREIKLQRESELKKELINAPWLKFENIKTEGIDKITFHQMRDNIAGYYYEKVRKEIADEKEKLQAVLFYSQKEPDKISIELNEQIIAILKNDERIKE